MPSERQQFDAAVAALESQRALLGDAVVDLMLETLRGRIATLGSSTAIAAHQLKQVTILFLDVVDSTKLTRALDPETISSVMDGALTRATAVVQAHRGKVLQYAGDSLLAAFGADQAFEDDSERAVRCGLALIALGHRIRYAEEARDGQVGFNLRVGVHTGRVLLGAGVDAEGSIRGIAVNIAARMEQTAPAGALRISHDTYMQVRGVFEVDAQEPIAVKGIDEPIQSYLVRRTNPRSFRVATRGIEGIETRMVGRDIEFGILKDEHRKLYETGALASITVVSDAGLGKSRLLHEFESWCETLPSSIVFMRGRASTQTQSQPFGLLRDILAARFQINDDDTLELAHAKVEKGIVPLFMQDDGADEAEAHAHLLGHLIGIDWCESRHLRGILDDPRQIRSRAFHAAAQLFRRLSASEESPIVLEVEDLHWADGETLDFLEHLAVVDRDVPLLILASLRPTLFERRAGWRMSANERRLDLSPLNKDDSGDLADELLQKLDEVSLPLRSMVSARSEGNPFYMEELVKMLIDQGAIETGATWQVNPERLRVTHVPATLVGVLQARLDSLPAQERATLQAASVIGLIFWDQALIALDGRAVETLPALVQRRLAQARTDYSSDGFREYAFKHAILHQVTYATVLKRDRRAMHDKVAHWFAKQAGLRANDFLAAAAEHFFEAGDVANAAEFHTRVAEQARQRFAHEAVMTNVKRALDLIERIPIAESRGLRWRLLEAREATLDVQGDREAQRADVEALEALAEEVGDHQRRAYAAWRRSDLSRRLADFDTAEAAARRVTASAAISGDATLRLVASRMIALAQMSRGEFVAAQELATQTLEEARALKLHAVESLCLNTLGMIVERRGDVVATLVLMRQSLDASRRAGNRRGEAIALGNVGGGWLNLGELAKAGVELEEAHRLVLANGDRVLECGALCALSILHLWRGDASEAQSLACTALEAALAAKARDWEAIARFRKGEAEHRMGELPASLQSYRQARDCAQALEDPLQYDAAAGLARVFLAMGDASSALEAIEPVLAIDACSGSGDSSFEGTDYERAIELTCHQVLEQVGDPRAGAWLRRAHDAVLASAAGITDARLRASFLRNIPHNREIMTTWARRQNGVDNTS